MVNIAILEDNKTDIEKIQHIIDRYAKENNLEYSSNIYTDGLVLLSEYKPIFDIVFMDIEVPYVNGLKAAEKIREFDSEVVLVFVTNLKQYALKGYEVDAMDFLVKPISYAAFSTMMGRIMKRIETKTHVEIIIQNSKDLYRIALSDIYYIEVMQHYIIYHTTKGRIKFWGSLKDEEKRLPKDAFARCNSCYLIHLAYVQKVEDNYVYIANGKLKLSRGKKVEFMNSLLEYINGRC